MNRSTFAVAIALTASLFGAPAAFATVTASISGTTLSATGDGAADTLTAAISSDDQTFSVTNTGINTPAGCTKSGDTLSCTTSATGVTKLNVSTGGGDDTITVNDAYGAGNGFVVDAGPGNDTLNGTSALTSDMTGGADNDTFNGSAQQSDTFIAEPGADTYHGGTATIPASESAGIDPDQVQLEFARDEYIASDASTADVNVSLDGAANDGTAGEGDNVGADIEEVEGARGNDTLTAGGSAVEFYGETGNDTLVGSPKGDELDGGEGSDVVQGGAGDDELFDGDESDPYVTTGSPAPPPVGNDHLDGGAGNDKLQIGLGADDAVGGAGVDNVYVARYLTQSVAPGTLIENYPPLAFQPMTISLDDLPNDGGTGTGEGDNIHSDVENIDTADFGYQQQLGFAGSQNDTANDNITGSAASNRIDTGGGNDTVDGLGGADVINTGTGDDTINAADGFTDLVDCGAGTDSINADLPGANPDRADVLTDCETVTGTALGPPLVITPVPKPPLLALSGSTKIKSKTFLKSYALSVSVTSDQAYTATGDVIATGAKIAKVGDLSIGSGKLAAGTGKRTLKLTVAKSYRASLKRKLRTKAQRKKGIKLRVAITVANASGQATTSTRSFTIKG